jgi:hypothetical protein
MDALRNGLSNELKDSLQHVDMPDNIIDFIKMCSMRDSQIRAGEAKKPSGQWKGGIRYPTMQTKPHLPQRHRQQEQ